MIDSYLMLIDEIQLEEEYRNELIIEGVVGSLIEKVKGMFKWFIDKVVGMLKKLAGIFKKEADKKKHFTKVFYG